MPHSAIYYAMTIHSSAIAHIFPVTILIGREREREGAGAGDGMAIANRRIAINTCSSTLRFGALTY